MRAKENPAAKVDFTHWIGQLQEAGFLVTPRDQKRLVVSKHGCGAELERTPAGELRIAVRPGLLTRDGIARLLDRGYQKFWQEGQREFPALAGQLMALHQFDSELRAILGWTSLYNEALGTVSSRYHYDRLEGREHPKRRRLFN